MLPERRHARLSGYDYSTPAAYFVTICAAQRQMLFGTIRNGALVPTALGQLVLSELAGLAEHYPGTVGVDISGVMPNHLHLIVALLQLLRRADAASRVPTVVRQPYLDEVIGGLKSGITRKGRLILADSTARTLQPRFYDHIIRHEKALHRMQEYIVNNPRQWELDRENPARSGENEFYAWLEAYCAKTRTVVE